MKPTHGSEHIEAGNLRGATDRTDYFYFFCPRCADNRILRILDFKMLREEAGSKYNEKCRSKAPNTLKHSLKLNRPSALRLYLCVCLFHLVFGSVGPFRLDRSIFSKMVLPFNQPAHHCLGCSNWNLFASDNSFYSSILCETKHKQLGCIDTPMQRG